MSSFKIKIGGYTVTENTPKKQLDALKKSYPHLTKFLKDGKTKDQGSKGS